ncbi:MAG TPA: hypothetical protein VFZ27_16895 [Terriglobia bacterium]|nr:hypothetical protein [Terriglobia bacterium]
MLASIQNSLLRTALLVIVAAHAVPARASTPNELQTGFHQLYETRFEEARSHFLVWEKANPQDPLGHAWEGASYLFEILYQQGVLTSRFFLDNNQFLNGAQGEPNRAFATAFSIATRTAQELARQRLKANPADAEALFALTITTGMLADYSSLIEKRQFQSLRFVRESEKYARRLLAVKPDSGDAYLALGAANYIIGSLPGYKRLFLRLGGIRGDRQLGMKQLQVAATQGEYLKPFAKILLALIDLREGQLGPARTLLEQLAFEFPHNPLFARELAVLARRAGEPVP